MVANFYRLILTLLLIFAGGLLVLSGFGLIELSKDLLLYLGVGLLTLAVLVYILGRRGHGEQ